MVRGARWSAFVLRTPAFALGAARRANWISFVLRTPVFALGAARRAQWITFVLRTPVFALGAARRAHEPCSLRAGRAPGPAGVQVALDTLMVGNLAEKSLALSAIFTATWRATAL